MSEYGIRVGYDAEMSCTASKVPEQRSWLSTRLGTRIFGCSLRFGLRQRTKWAYVALRSDISESRSLMKRRDTELNVPDFFAFPPSFGSNICLITPFELALSAASKSGWSVSLFFSMKLTDM